MAPKCTHKEVVGDWSIEMKGKKVEAGTLVAGTVVETEAKPLCTVGVSLNRTVNLGNYESARIGVSLHVPCEAKEIEGAYKIGLGWCEKKLTELLAKTGQV